MQKRRRRQKLQIFTVRNEVAKVMFLHLSVILFTRWGGIPVCTAGGIPACLAAGLQGGACSGGCLLQGGAPLRKQTATVADGTHPSGMHSCQIGNRTLFPTSQTTTLTANIKEKFRFASAMALCERTLIKACSYRRKANAKAKKDQGTTGRDQRKNFKYQKKFFAFAFAFARYERTLVKYTGSLPPARVSWY